MSQPASLQPVAAEPGIRPAAADQLRPGGVTPGRLAWLDALRGIAVLFVVFDHLSHDVLTGLRGVITPWFDTGTYGVMVFFLVSGYVVPASLERNGSARRFWISRAFRLYPMWALAVAAVVALAVLGITGLRGAAEYPASSALAHMLMLQDLLGIRDAVNVLWTLSYEMTFYLLITSLFVVRVHRRSAGFAAGFAVAALALGGILPTQALTGTRFSTLLVVVATAGAILAGLAAVLLGRHWVRLAGAVLLAATVLALITLNSRAWVWESYSILAWMFTGTVIYRAEHGQISKRTAAVTAAAVLVLTVAAAIWHSYPWGLRPGIPTMVLAAATFAAGMVLWRRRAPKSLAWIGLVSYSAYLLHPLLIAVFFGSPWTRDRDFSGPIGIAVAVVFLACLLGTCWAAYRFVESPAQRLGRRLACWFDTRLGPDTRPPARQPVPVTQR